MHQYIKQTALSLGFDACGIAKAEALADDAALLKQWLSEGKNGEMHYLERNFEKRTDPRMLVPDCKSVVVVLMNYYPAKHQPDDAPRVARYAYPETDYHTVVKTKLKALEDALVQQFGNHIVNPYHQHAFVDSAPVLERRWAQRAGLGWIGKHTQLIAPETGSYCFVGVLMLNAETLCDMPMPERCGTCTRCIDACPTNALTAEGMDARRCISYQTIEKKNAVDDAIKPLLSGCVLGCDICAEVCPWNEKWAKPNNHLELKPTDELLSWQQKEWEQLSEEKFKQVFKKSAIKRAGFAKLKENIKFATQSGKTN